MLKTKRNSIYYETVGDGTPILLISGLGADHFFWGQVINKLKNDYMVIAIDNRGAGNTAVIGENCTTRAMAEDVIEVLDELNIESASLVGHSLGGCVAQQVAIQFPDRVNKLVLCSTHAKLSALRHHQMQTNVEMMRANVPREYVIKNALTWFYSNNFFENKENITKAVEFAMSKPLEKTRKNYLYQVEAFFEHDTSGRLSEIACPTLVVGGEEDMLVPLSALQSLSRQLPNAKLITVPGMGHMYPIEGPVGFSALVRDHCRV